MQRTCSVETELIDIISLWRALKERFEIMESPEKMEELKARLRVALGVLRLPDFRPGQEEASLAVLQGRDTVVRMPTAGGKSLCYLLPALCMDGLTLVVSPLIALMNEQV